MTCALWLPATIQLSGSYADFTPFSSEIRHFYIRAFSVFFKGMTATATLLFRSVDVRYLM